MSTYPNALRNPLDFKDMLDNHPDLIVKTDPVGYPLYTNHTFNRIFESEAMNGAPFLFLKECCGSASSPPDLNVLASPPYQAYTEACSKVGDGCIWIGWILKAFIGLDGKIEYILCSGRDITTQKTLEDALRKQKERFALAFEGANDALYDWDFETNLVAHSPRWKEMFGFTGRQDTHHIDDWKTMIHPDDIGMVLQKQRDHFAGKTTHYLAEYRVTTYTGERKWILSRGRAVCDASGSPLRMAGSNTDITELRHNQEQVKEISGLLKATLDTIPDIIGIQDNNHNILQYNEAGHKFFNSANSNITGKTCFHLMGRIEECHHCAVARTIDTGQPVHREQYDPLHDRWLDVRTYPVLDNNGRVTKVVEHLRDITSSKKVAEELQRSNSILKAQQESAIDGILIVDENRMVVDFNQRFLDLWNIPKEQVSSTSSKEKELLLLVSTSVLNPQSFIDSVESLYKHPTGISRDEIYFLDGKVLDRYTAPVVSPSGTCYGRIWFFRDITAIKDNERALKISIEKNELLLQDIVELDRLKTEFFSNISHELRTPINVIFSTLQLKDLYHRTGENVMNEFQLKYNKIIKQNCYRLLRLINNLIDITKVDAGFYDLSLKNHNIVSLVEDITCSVADYIKNKGLSLIFDTDIEEIMMACDLEKIERILLNLLSNAVKYTKFGGSIHVNVYGLDNKVQISVKDTGMGIPSNKLALIFERFMQVNSSFTRDQEGSGIGLSLVKKLVEMQGGTISVTSTVEQGSEFILILPVTTVESKAIGLKQYVESLNDSRIERINIEFSDIYTL